MANNFVHIKQMVDQLNSDREQTGDAIFLVESERIHAHRNVLAALSPKYKAQFYGPNPDQGEIRIPNVSAAAFKEFLQFFYKESVDLTMGNVETVLDLVHQSLVGGFIDICADFLKKSITTSNVCFVYHLAIMYDIGALRLDCEQQITSETVEVFASDGFLQCDGEVLLSILKLNTLNCFETDVFNACIEWARADCKRNGLDEKNPENLRKVLGDAIYQVRFASMNPQEFAAALYKLLDGFFAAKELAEILFITTEVKDFTAQKFEQTPRTPLKDHLEAIAGSQRWSLECNRFEGIKEDRINSNPNFKTSIHCDKPIRLYGIALGFHLNEFSLNSYKDSGKLFISVGRDNGPLVWDNISCQVHQVKNETIILFANPIERLTTFEKIFAQSSFQGKHELVLKDQVEIGNTRFTCSGDLVTRFFFDNVLDIDAIGKETV